MKEFVPENNANVLVRLLNHYRNALEQIGIGDLISYMHLKRVGSPLQVPRCAQIDKVFGSKVPRCARIDKVFVSKVPRCARNDRV